MEATILPVDKKLVLVIFELEQAGTGHLVQRIGGIVRVVVLDKELVQLIAGALIDAGKLSGPNRVVKPAKKTPA